MDDTAKNGQEKQNYLVSAEMDEEGNYNMIDGIINNTKKPSILEHIRNFKPEPPEAKDKPAKTIGLEP